MKTIRDFLNENVISAKDKRELTKAIVSKKTGKISLKSIKTDIKISDIRGSILVHHPSGDQTELIMALTDISDTLGYDFRQNKNSFLIKS